MLGALLAMACGKPSAGNIQEVQDSTFGLHLQNDGTQFGFGGWVTPTTSLFAAKWEMAASVIAGTTPEGAATDTWLDMATSRSFYFSGGGSCTLRLQFRDKATAVVRNTQDVDVSGSL